MTAPTLTCEHCESEIDVEADPRCIQDGGMDVMCEGCRERAWRSVVLPCGPAGGGDLNLPMTAPEPIAAHREACRIKRGWQA